jgi:hypothetical protein
MTAAIMVRSGWRALGAGDGGRMGAVWCGPVRAKREERRERERLACGVGGKFKLNFANSNST